jgi:AhpD family alkylhydroperoxidase
MELKDFERVAPAARAALTALSKAATDGGLDKALVELIKIRASQINGCAFCLQFHLRLARTAGVPQLKLDLLAAWREAGIYSERELAALEWTEALTKITPQGIDDAVYATATAAFSETELAALTAAVVGINAWNRIAIAYRFTPPIP